MAVERARVARLRSDVETRAEDRPGVYRMVDGHGEPLYVGKSVRVRSRLLSYFRAPPGDKAADLIRSAATVDWEYVPNEFWATVRELRLIKEWIPRYNVEHARRTRYAFVKLTREPAPRLLLVGRAADDGCIHFGPFPRPARLAETIRDLSHTIGIRDCSGSTPIRFGDQLEMFGSGPPPRCLRTDTGSCLAPCAGRCTEAEYAERVDVARRFLEGRSREPLRRLEERMRDAAARYDYEYAALLRDRKERLASLQGTL
ncbi:MAG: nuclease, partial [Longimicrobiales bacterium]